MFTPIVIPTLHSCNSCTWKVLGFCFSMNSFNIGHTVILLSSEGMTFLLWHSSSVHGTYSHGSRWLISWEYLVWSFLGIPGCKQADTKLIDPGFWPSWLKLKLLTCEGHYFYWTPARVLRHIASLVQILEQTSVTEKAWEYHSTVF